MALYTFRFSSMPSDSISYSDKYDDDHFEYRDGWNESPSSIQSFSN